MSDAQHSAVIARLQRDLSDPGDFGGLPRGMIGAFTPGGEPRYAYPEIAGYWLHWASNCPEIPQATGTAVIDAIADLRLSRGLWPTRTGLGGESVPMHYQQSHYLFDHAMLWDGLRHWAAVRRCNRAALLADGLWEALDCFVVEGRLCACVPDRADPLRDRKARESGWRQEKISVPRSRWSSCFGPFLLKACARLLHGRGALAQLCADAVDELAELALRAPHVQAHPQLYAIEGLIELNREPLALQVLRRLLHTHRGADSISEYVGGGPRRSDVLAQLLSTACLLGLDDERDPGWSRLADELAERVDPQGRLPFADPEEERPTWAALFALEALQTWSAKAQSGKMLA